MKTADEIFEAWIASTGKETDIMNKDYNSLLAMITERDKQIQLDALQEAIDAIQDSYAGDVPTEQESQLLLEATNTILALRAKVEKGKI